MDHRLAHESLSVWPAIARRRLPVLLLLLATTLQVVHCLFEHQLPIPFDEQRLPGQASQRTAHTEFVENLGNIIKLDSPALLQPSRSGSISAKFSLHNRRKSTGDIIFEPQKVCFSSGCYGPYQFNVDQLASSGYNASLKTVIFVSGFMTKDRVSWIEQAKDILLQLDDVNVIVVTWKDLNRYIYTTAVANTPLVARQITILLHYLASLEGVQLDDLEFTKRIHFVGHSLGAHIGGFVGQDLGGRMGRITGLDPAGPSFDLVGPGQRLDPTDAVLVDVIHTNSGRMRYLNLVADAAFDATSKLFGSFPGLGRSSKQTPTSPSRLSSRSASIAAASETDGGENSEAAWYGLDDQVGHIDYYANGGRVQPGCSGALHTCDHRRSHDIYLAILKHELQLRSYSLSSQRLGQDRLLAFDSPDYESFLAGYNFAQKCPTLLNTAETIDGDNGGAYTGESDGTARTNSANFNQCTLPIDMLTPIDELRNELNTRYGFNFEFFPHRPQLASNFSYPNQAGVNVVSAANVVNAVLTPQPAAAINRKFYFRTHSEMPFVGDHSLLKIRLSNTQSAQLGKQLAAFNNWDSSCTLLAELRFGYGLSITIEVNRANGLHLIDNGQFYGLAVPLVSPHGADARDALNRVLVSSMLKRGPELIATILDPLIKVLPAEVSLSVVDSAAASLIQKVKDKIINLFTSYSARDTPQHLGMQAGSSPRCQLQIRSIEVQPIVSYGRSFVGLYGLHSVPLVLAADQLEPARLVTPLGPNSGNNKGPIPTRHTDSNAPRPSIFIVKPGEQVTLLRNLQGDVGQISLQDPDLSVKLDAVALE